VKTKERKRIIARTNGLPKGCRKDGEVRPGTPMRSTGMGQNSWTNEGPPPPGVFQLDRSWRLSNMGRALVPTPLSSCGRIRDGDEELSHVKNAIDVLDDSMREAVANEVARHPGIRLREAEKTRDTPDTAV
jgi:hypothetical protein